MAWTDRRTRPLHRGHRRASAPEQKQYPQPVPLRSKAGAKNLAARQETSGTGSSWPSGRHADDPALRRALQRPQPLRRRAAQLHFRSQGRRAARPAAGQVRRGVAGVDDILVYTYDQDAWLCSEFGPCPRCLGVPLHERLAPFLNELARAWRRLSPQGRLWWEPWELSAGQVLRCVERLQPEGLGLALHSNIAEVMATHPVDRWFKNTCGLALRRGIPVIAECFLGATSEEVEPFLNLAHPLVTLRALKALAAVPGVVGIKEYYGLAPDREDPNLRMTGLFFANPRITEDEALRELARPYGKAARKMIGFWRLASEGMELFPWETSWFIREVGPEPGRITACRRRCSEAMDCPRRRWRSSRHGTFMRTEPEYPPDPWMLEDVQLRCEVAADRMRRALNIGAKLRRDLPEAFSAGFARNLFDLGRFDAGRWPMRTTSARRTSPLASARHEPTVKRRWRSVLPGSCRR